MTAEDKMDYSEEVRDALSDGKPLVALESTIMTHGMPFPENRTKNKLPRTHVSA